MLDFGWSSSSVCASISCDFFKRLCGLVIQNEVQRSIQLGYQWLTDCIFNIDLGQVWHNQALSPCTSFMTWRSTEWYWIFPLWSVLWLVVWPWQRYERDENRGTVTPGSFSDHRRLQTFTMTRWSTTSLMSGNLMRYSGQKFVQGFQEYVCFKICLM